MCTHEQTLEDVIKSKRINVFVGLSQPSSAVIFFSFMLNLNIKRQLFFISLMLISHYFLVCFCVYVLVYTCVHMNECDCARVSLSSI